MLAALGSAFGGGGGGGNKSNEKLMGALGTAATAPAAIAEAGITVTANDEMQRRNRERLDELLGMEASGQLGLTGEQRAMLDRGLNVPVQQAALAGQQRAERIAAAAIIAADEARAQQQRNEIEQRVGLKAALKRDDWDAILGAARTTMGVAGQAAGAPPGTYNLAGPMGTEGPGNVAAASADASTPTPTEASAAVPGASGPADSAGQSAAGGQGLARTAQPAPSGLSESETKELAAIAERDPRLFAQIFLMRARQMGATRAA